MNAERTGVVIELIGAPGAGKSSLAHALGTLDGVTVVKDHDHGDLTALAWSLARSWPVAVTPPHDVERLRWAAWAGRVTAARHIAEARRAAGARAVVFDQGPAYTLVRMMQLRSRRHGQRWWWNRGRATARLLDLLVVLDADNETLASRLHRRSKEHQTDAMSASSLCAYLTAERQACHAVADVLAREGADVRRLSTAGIGLEEQVDLVRAWVDQHLAARQQYVR